jgi:hypothetical protein
LVAVLLQGSMVETLCSDALRCWLRSLEAVVWKGCQVSSRLFSSFGWELSAPTPSTVIGFRWYTQGKLLSRPDELRMIFRYLQFNNSFTLVPGRGVLGSSEAVSEYLQRCGYSSPFGCSSVLLLHADGRSRPSGSLIISSPFASLIRS